MQSLSRSAARYVSKLSNKIRRHTNAFSLNGKLSGAQGRILHFILAQTDDIFQKDIEEEYSLRPSSATEILKKMEQNGLIHREPTSYDGRLKKIIPSEKAIHYQKQVITDLTKLEHDLTKGIDPEQLEIFFQVMEKMLKNLS
ncbi:MAG TPA: winged helix-turn-helix transcriptional regulator [Candidatus Fimimorpha faecalis]|uniref:Winged helix-turn-helix transcriptional regulator n=1 Tax=Candidatus Fimimorpha faecalis TaxID=2840824 RepID=A0A9D1ECQ7_9FIRM|nr:winged helix-turn-helix transcriptional regulator [Candidatus Fimimorpha faecalis]